ncbi:MAG: BamA/TamA family outer membrane protein [Balneolaceae bacterium]
MFFFFQNSVSGQDFGKADSVKLAILPAIAFNSDLGFIFGGIVNKYDYKDEMKPFYSFTSVSGIFSTKGLASFELALDKPKAFGTNIRLSSSIYAFRFLQNTYFGLANYDKINFSSSELPKLYEFQSFSVGFNTTLRIPLLEKSTSRQLDILAILNFDYETPWENGTDRLIALEQPLGYKGGRTFMLGTGLIWEGRNSEFNPTSGTYFETSLELGDKVWGSSFNTLVLKHDMRNYFTFTLGKDITLANRFFLKHTSGDTPYWKLAYAGDDETLRGYPSKRFIDDNVVILNNELRTWLFNFQSINTKLGGTIFVDVGRTFSNQTSINTIKRELKYTYGFGATSSFFTPDFIIRADIGFSEEETGVYITVGYMF